ncbi:PRTRC system protein E [Nocardioides silvaticus]|uniref:PRTRC system protein E n=1 Tax=Nocardioides silvaticus TaxID=2201891 RepID=A0A316TIA7_9ACTN|nr:BtrH N-terminal domain-containing protein [Nocardioides silvaticus]PWN04277.1 PRTRC system protein E [Nocardioides silvaticus]
MITGLASVQVSPYPHRIGGHCGSGALRDLLEWAGLGWDGPPSEGLVFTLGGALGLSYVRSPDLFPPLYLVGRGGELELDLPRRLGGTAQQRATDDPAEGWAWVRSEVEEGRPVMVWADIAELPYLRVKLSMSRHDIVVLGYDDEAQVALVVDNDREEVQEVPYDALARARRSTSFPQPTRHTVYDITWPGELPDLASAAAEAFAQSARAMTELAPVASIFDDEPPAPGDAGGLSGATHQAVHTAGVAAASAFAEDIADWEQHDDEELEIMLFSLGAFIEKAGTGGGLFRRLLAQGTSEIAQTTEDDATASLARSAKHAAQAWTSVARAATTRDQPARERARHAAQAASVLPGLESNLTERLQAAAASLRS